VRRALALATVGLALALGACQRAPAPLSPVSAPVVDHVAEAHRALAAQQWAVAAEHLRAALRQDATSLFLHYGLAVCATWLDAKGEATREFEWVVANAPAESDEAKIARRWLAANRGGKRSAAVQPAADDPTRGDSGLHGMVTWADPGQGPAPQGRQQLVLAGLRGTPTKGLIYVRRATQEGRYEFKDVPPGPYRLSGDAPAGPTRWRLKVELKPGKDLALDLTPDNSISVRDDFRQTK
jgi:hypothetical protein